MESTAIIMAIFAVIIIVVAVAFRHHKIIVAEKWSEKTKISLTKTLVRLLVLLIIFILMLLSLLFISPVYRGLPPAQYIPIFADWPPPRSSASHVLARWVIVTPIDHQVLGRFRSQWYEEYVKCQPCHGQPKYPIFMPTFGSVAEKIEHALSIAGYKERSYYLVPDGFILVTRLEKFNRDGLPVTSSERWVVELQPLSIFSISPRSFIKVLLRAQPGYYRTMVFVVTSQPFSQTSKIVNRIAVQEWLQSGANILSGSIRNQAYTDDYACTVLVYEFEQPAVGERARFIEQSPLTGEDHLLKSGILAALIQRRE